MRKSTHETVNSVPPYGPSAGLFAPTIKAASYGHALLTVPLCMVNVWHVIESAPIRTGGPQTRVSAWTSIHRKKAGLGAGMTFRTRTVIARESGPQVGIPTQGGLGVLVVPLHAPAINAISRPRATLCVFVSTCYTLLGLRAHFDALKLQVNERRSKL